MHQMDQYLPEFLTDMYTSIENIRSALTYVADIPDENALYEVMRLFHSMKSAAAMMSFAVISEICIDQEKKFKEVYEKKVTIYPALQPEGLAAVERIHGMLETIEKTGPDTLRTS